LEIWKDREMAMMCFTPIYFRSLTWSTLPSLNTARELHTMGFLNGKITINKVLFLKHEMH
jgi:hypothetical protein